MSPPIPSILPREVLPGGISIDGEYIPAGVDVGVPHYAIHHNDKYFPESFSYKPERWLPGFGFDIPLARSTFTPFGVGRTSCVGQYLAYQEMSLILARLVWQFDMRIQMGSTLGEGREG